MNKNIFIRIRQHSLVIFLIVVLQINLFAGTPEKIPELSGRVVDASGVFTSAEISHLDEKLAKCEEETGSQIVVLIISTTGAESIEEYSIRVAEKWKIGQAENDNGVILIVAKKDRKLRIEVGYGLEGLIPDLAAARVIDDYILPEFKNGDFTEGINEGTDRIISLIKQDELEENSKNEDPVRQVTDSQRAKIQTTGGMIILLLLIAVPFVFLFLIMRKLNVFLAFVAISVIVFVVGIMYLEYNPVVLKGGIYMGIVMGGVLGLKLWWRLFVVMGWAKPWDYEPVRSYSGSSSSGYSYSSSYSSSSYSSSSSAGSSYSSGSSFSGGGGSFGGGGASGSW